MSLVFKLRDGKLIVPLEYYERYLNIDWFISSLVNFENLKDKDEEVTLWEDKNALLSLFDSIKFSKLTIHGDISLDYLLNLCDMWCAPKWISEDIKKRITENKNSKLENSLIDNYIFRCRNCKAGFKIKDNTNNSCNTHIYTGLNDNNKFHCCGLGIGEGYCVVGYHCVDNDEFIKIKKALEEK